MPFFQRLRNGLKSLFDTGRPATPTRSTTDLPLERPPRQDERSTLNRPVAPSHAETPPKPPQTQQRVTPDQQGVVSAAVTRIDNREIADSWTQNIPDPKQPCPHGIRRREYCAICDPDGYRAHYGDWTSD